MWHVARSLAQLYVEGGLTVLTPAPPAETPPAGAADAAPTLPVRPVVVPTGCGGSTRIERGPPVLARTVIQPDGDVVTKIDPRVARDLSIWRTHRASVEQEIRLLQRSRAVLDWTRYVSVPVLGVGAYNAAVAAAAGDLLGALGPVVLPLGLAVLGLASKALAVAALRRYVAHAFNI